MNSNTNGTYVVAFVSYLSEGSFFFPPDFQDS